MPFIAVDLANVQTFDSLPVAKYAGSIDALKYKEPDDPTKFPQLMVTYLVVDGDLTGRRSTEFLSMSPNALFRLKKWLSKFGLDEDFEGIETDDDDPTIVLQPDLIGVDVIFEVYRDPKLYQGEVQYRTRLVEVLDGPVEAAPAPTPAPAPRATRPPAAPVPDTNEDEETDAEDEAPEEAAPAAPAAPARRTFQRAPAAAAAGPARRKLS